METTNDNPAEELLRLIDEAEFTRVPGSPLKLWELPQDGHVSRYEGLWHGSIEMLAVLLCSEQACSVHNEVKKLHANFHFGVLLGRLAEMFPKRVVRKDTSAYRGWLIGPPLPASLQVRSDTNPVPAHGWTCFHCGETLTTVSAAREHFGRGPDRQPGCVIKVEFGGERGLLTALRAAEDELARYREEDGPLQRELAALQCRHAPALVAAEEAGYARGLRDAVKWSDAVANPPRDICQPVLGYSPAWVDADFNRSGVRECFLTDEGSWFSARWDNDQDCWQVDTKTKPTLWLDVQPISPRTDVPMAQ